MRTPPPVSVEWGDEPFWRWAQALVRGAALLVVVAWIAAHRELPPSWPALAAGVGLAGALGWAWRPGAARPIRLTFDGTVWSCVLGHAGDAPRRCSVRVALDLGGWLLLCIDTAAPPGSPGRIAWFGGRPCRCWRAISPRLAGTGWQALRVALYCAEQGHRGRAGSARLDE
jgi:hypothetical protein